MTANEITRFVNSRAMVAVTGIIMLAAARFAFQECDMTYMDVDRGILFTSPNLWISNTWLKMVLSTALILGIGLVWMLIIQIFNPFRALTTLQTSFFLIMMTATPDLLDQFYSGTLMCVTIIVCLTLLWSSFADMGKIRHIFLLFTILSALSMAQYCFAVYIPVFIIGCVQMKIFSFKTVIAIVLGLITPWWIALGSGLATFDDLHLPAIASAFSTFDLDDTIHIVLVSAVTAVIFIGAWCGCVMKVLTLNANLRAFNGSISLVGLATLVALIVDFSNAAAYLPTLYLVASYQLAYLIATGKGSRRFVPVFCIMALYIALFVWRLIV